MIDTKHPTINLRQIELYIATDRKNPNRPNLLCPAKPKNNYDKHEHSFTNSIHSIHSHDTHKRWTSALTPRLLRLPQPTTLTTSSSINTVSTPIQQTPTNCPSSLNVTFSHSCNHWHRSPAKTVATTTRFMFPELEALSFLPQKLQRTFTPQTQKLSIRIARLFLEVSSNTASTVFVSSNTKNFIYQTRKAAKTTKASSQQMKNKNKSKNRRPKRWNESKHKSSLSNIRPSLWNHWRIGQRVNRILKCGDYSVTCTRCSVRTRRWLRENCTIWPLIRGPIRSSVIGVLWTRVSCWTALGPVWVSLLHPRVISTVISRSSSRATQQLLALLLWVVVLLSVVDWWHCGRGVSMVEVITVKSSLTVGQGEWSTRVSRE